MFEDFLNNQNSWLNGRGPEAGIVFSSRIRLARNISGIPFPCRASDLQKKEALCAAKKTFCRVKDVAGSSFVEMDSLDSLDRHILLERHLVGPEHMACGQGKAVIVSKDESISIMVNEEDHFRMQVIVSGFDLGKCWNVINNIDNSFSKEIPFAFSSDLGYLTACPTNVGTGMRASCMMHLPALIFTKRINKILELLTRISFTTRGLFGEGTQALGDFFQISNQASLGQSEEELIDNLMGVVNQVKGQEIDARDALMRKYRHNLEDSVWRALGILRNCRLINSKEALSHLSVLSLGLDLGIINDKDLSCQGRPRQLINSLFIEIQPAHLQKIEAKSLKEKERDSVRADILRERLSKE
ncbi:MAG: protein arginine kinase [Candidatus Omnitrophica bacterium]|nr:protein arginine kinase [Candidatus Omnitrophota bacterium]MDD5430224.1 protein arginine kinase [Candidatus Omnitrophota bacterium]